MENSFASQPDSGSYINLKKRVFQKVQAAGINDQIFMSVQRTFEDALTQENIILSRPERKRLLSQMLKLVLEDMAKKLDDRFNSE
jgi:hypothetical protein